MQGASSLSITGDLALETLPLVAPKYFREGEGHAKVNLKLGGNFDHPEPSGDLTFESASLILRPIRANVENLNGSVKLTPNSMIFEKLQGTMREGDLTVNGNIALQNFKPTFYDLKIDTREVAVSEPGVYKIIFSGDFALKGPPGNAVLSGIMDINDGVYSRDFSLSQTLLKPETPTVKEPPSELLKDIVLDLQVRSPGELAIKNNVARIFFKSDLQLSGPALQPKISGALSVLDGEFHYFTVDFQDAKGTIDFRNPQRGPYASLDLTKNYSSSFTDVTALVHIEGFSDNLQLSLSSNPPLERRDLMALVFTGVLPGDARRNLSGTNVASTIIASQLSQVIQRPLAKNAHLDIFRLEAGDPEQTSAISTLVIGRHLTDRLSLEYKTDLGVDKPLQGVQMEYLLIDNVLFKATQFNDGAFDFDLALRFQLF
jgi:autotransporter translocation and assembly factor TamB